MTHESWRRCTQCGRERATQDFPERTRGSGQRRGYCRACKATMQHRWYARNRTRHIANVKTWREANPERRAAIAARNRAIIVAAKDGPCLDCGAQLPAAAMDFDHVRGQKTKNVSRMLGSSVLALQAEIAKCDLVCVNCHRTRTTESVRARKEYPRSDSNRRQAD